MTRNVVIEDNTSAEDLKQNIMRVSITMPMSQHMRDMHDHMGNCEELQSVEVKAKLEAGDWRRVSGDVICKKCGKIGYDHPRVMGALWLNVLCDGSLVKF